MKIDQPVQPGITETKAPAPAQAEAATQPSASSQPVKTPPSATMAQLADLQKLAGNLITAKILQIQLNAASQEALPAKPLTADQITSRGVDIYKNNLLTAAKTGVKSTFPAAESVSRLWQITLQLAGLSKPLLTEFKATTIPQDWAPGKILSLNLDPKTGLKIIPESPSQLESMTRSEAMTRSVSQSLSRLLPLQADLRNSLGTLIAAARQIAILPADGSVTTANAPPDTGQSQDKLVPARVRELLQVLTKTLLEPAQSKDPGALKAALNQTGITLEAKLLTNGKQAIQTDTRPAPTPANDARSRITASPPTRTDHHPGSRLNAPLLQAAPNDLKGLVITSTAAIISHLQQTATNHTLPANWESLTNWLLTRTSHFSQTGHPLDFPGQSAATPRQIISPEGLDAGEILRALAQTLVRIQVNQLNSVQQSTGQPGEPPPNQVWCTEIPILGQQLDSVQMRLEKEEQQPDKKQPKHRWKLILAFDFDNTGPIQSHIIYTEGTVSGTFWAEQQQTLQRINQELPKLRQGLKDWGIAVGSIEVRKGQPLPPRQPISHQLLDERA